MNRLIKLLMGGLVSIAMFFSVQAFAASKIIEDAKADCVIGEQIDGYLGTVTGESPSAEVAREVRSVNQQRKAAYARLASKNGVTIDVTAKLTAEKLINDAPRGHCVQTINRTWRKK